MIARIIPMVMIALLFAQPSSAQLDRIFKGLGLGGQKGLSDAKIGEGEIDYVHPHPRPPPSKGEGIG